MTQVILDITISLDGYVTAVNAGPGNGLGDDGMALHAWAIGDRTSDDERVLAAAAEATGAVVMGRHTFDVVDAPDGWNDERHYGADHGDALTPCFVVTHEAPTRVRLTDRMRIVTTGLADAIAQARAVATAAGKDVYIMGGGELGASALRDRLVDRVHLHIAPLVLGGGDPLFARVPRTALVLDPLSSVVTPNAVHAFYTVA